MMPLSSRERLLAALRYEEPDHVPLLFFSFGFEPPRHLAWSDPVDEARQWLSIGVDAWLRLSLPLVFHPEVRESAWEEALPGERWPLMVKEYETPAGTLRQEVFRSDDWVSEEWPGHKDGDGGLALLDDYNVPRYRRPLIQTEEDVEKLRYLLTPLPDAALAGFRQRAEALARAADELGVMLVGYEPAGADVVTWLCGVEGMLFLALDRPALFGRLLEIIDEWDRRNVEILLDVPVDLVLRRGYYEGTTFWSPALYRRFFAPLIRGVGEEVHRQGRLMGYTMSVGVMPLLDTLADVGYDAHYLLDPLEGGQRIDLARVKEAFRGRTAVIGGINEPITLERGDAGAIRQEVHDAVRILGPGGGLALTAAEAIMASTPWSSVETVIEAWKDVRDYPIR
jgi:uroporphyrinogen-III decarboxylase